MNKNNILIYSLIAFIAITLSIIFIKPASFKKQNNLRVISPAPSLNSNIDIPVTVGSELTAKAGWDIYKGVNFDIAYPSGYKTQISDAYELAKFSSASQKIEYQVYLPEKPKALDKSFSPTAAEKVESESKGQGKTCDKLICTTEVTIISGADYKRRSVVRKNSDGLVTMALSVQYPSSQEESILKDFNYFQEVFVTHKK